MFNEFSNKCHDRAIQKGFYNTIKYVLENKSDESVKQYKNLFICQQLLLIITELGEATEALRKGDKNNFDEEIADTFIRLCDLSGFLKLDIDDEIQKKLKKNESRKPLHGKFF